MLCNAEKKKRLLYCYIPAAYDSSFRCLAEKLCGLNQSALKSPLVRVDMFSYGNKSTALDSNYKLIVKFLRVEDTLTVMCSWSPSGCRKAGNKYVVGGIYSIPCVYWQRSVLSCIVGSWCGPGTSQASPLVGVTADIPLRCCHVQLIPGRIKHQSGNSLHQ